MTKTNGKPCVKCGTSEWNSQGYCKECKRVNDRRWAAENREKRSLSQAKWKESNRERHLETKRTWQQKNKEKVNEYNRRSYRKNTEKNKKRSRAWRVSNPEKIKAWKRKNRSKILAYQQKRRAKEYGNGGSFSFSEWDALCAKYGNRCVRCGSDDELTADHIVPLSKGGDSYISNIQPLCSACNSSKGTKTVDYR